MNFDLSEQFQTLQHRVAEMYIALEQVIGNEFGTVDHHLGRYAALIRTTATSNR